MFQGIGHLWDDGHGLGLEAGEFECHAFRLDVQQFDVLVQLGIDAFFYLRRRPLIAVLGRLVELHAPSHGEF